MLKRASYDFLYICSRPQALVEGSLHYFRTHFPEEYVPQPLHRELLEGQLLSRQVIRKAELLGNRLAVVRSGNDILVCSPTGQTGQLIKLSVLRMAGERFEVFLILLNELCQCACRCQHVPACISFLPWT